MDGHGTNKLVKGAFLLTLAGLISKLLSAGYRIPLQNLTGDVGFYIYQQVYPLLGMVMILTLYGFPSAISKLTAEMKSSGYGLSIRSFYIPVFFILLALGCGLFLLLYMNAPNISRWIGDDDLLPVYQFAAFAFFLIPFLAIPRGVFQGSGWMRPTAYSQVIEQCIRVCIIIAVSIWIFIYGGNMYVIGQAAALASIIAGVGAFVVLSYFFLKQKPFTSNLHPVPWGFYMRSLLLFGVFFALNHMVLLIIQFADTFTLFPGLLKYGLDRIPAMEAKGVFDRGQPFIQLGTVLGSSFSLALIPSISRKKLAAGPVALSGHIRSALAIGTYIAFGATLGLILILPEANQLLYMDTAGTGSLQILVIAILLSSMVITALSILQGLDYMKRTALLIGCAFLIKWGLNVLLVPLWGITGSALATIGSLLFLTGTVFYMLHTKLPLLHFFQRVNWRALFIAGGGMAMYIILMDYALSWIDLHARFHMLVYVLFIVMSGAFVYIFLLIRWKAFSERELGMLPFSTFLLRLQKGRNGHGSN